jgi:branched-chain amino acid transport system substrate-binding protein
VITSDHRSITTVISLRIRARLDSRARAGHRPAMLRHLALACCLFLACRERRAPVAADVSPPAPTVRSEQAIVLGEIGSLTGSEASFGTATRDGIELAIRQANAAGGVKGRQIVVKVYDDQGKAEEAAAIMTKLITQDKVVAVLGEVSSSRSIAAAPIAQERRIPMISPSATNPKVTEIGDYIFRACFIDPFQGQVMAAFATRRMHAKTAAILRDNKSDYSLGLATFFTESFAAAGGKIVKDEMYASGDVHFKSQLTTIRAANPDVLFIPGYYTEAGLIARQARELGLQMPILGGDGWDSPKLLEIGGRFVENTYFANNYSEELPEVQRFINEFRAAFHYPPDGLASLGYEAALLVIDALKRAKDDSPQALRDALAATKALPGVTGPITIDAQRNAQKALVIIQVKDGKFRYLETIQPI